MLAYPARRMGMHRHAGSDGRCVGHSPPNFHDLSRRFDSEHQRELEIFREEQLANRLSAVKARAKLDIVAIHTRRVIAHQNLILAYDRGGHLLDFKYLWRPKFMNYDCAHHSTSTDSQISPRPWLDPSLCGAAAVERAD